VSSQSTGLTDTRATRRLGRLFAATGNVALRRIEALLAFASFCATARHTRPRTGEERPECHSAGLAPKRSSQRVMNWLVSAISGMSTSACLPLARAAAIASK